MTQDSPSSKVVPIHAKPKRRVFSNEYKLRILEEIDRASEFGQTTFILRREGLHSSHIAQWRKWRRRLESGEISPSPDPSAASLRRENERLQRRVRQLEKQNQRKQILLDMQKKLNETMEMLAHDNDESKP